MILLPQVLEYTIRQYQSVYNKLHKPAIIYHLSAGPGNISLPSENQIQAIKFQFSTFLLLQKEVVGLNL